MPVRRKWTCRYCRPQRPPASGAPPPDFTQKGGGRGLRPSWPSSQTYWISNELFYFFICFETGWVRGGQWPQARRRRHVRDSNKPPRAARKRNAKTAKSTQDKIAAQSSPQQCQGHACSDAGTLKTEELLESQHTTYTPTPTPFMTESPRQRWIRSETYLGCTCPNKCNTRRDGRRCLYPTCR